MDGGAAAQHAGPSAHAAHASSASSSSSSSSSSAVGEPDYFLRVKRAQRQLEMLAIQEDYIRDEMKNLKRELIRAGEEVKRIQSVPLTIGSFSEMVDEHHGLLNATTGTAYYVRVLSTIDRERLKPNASVALHRHSHAVVDVLPPEADSTIQAMQSALGARWRARAFAAALAARACVWALVCGRGSLAHSPLLLLLLLPSTPPPPARPQ